MLQLTSHLFMCYIIMLHHITLCFTSYLPCLIKFHTVFFWFQTSSPLLWTPCLSWFSQLSAALTNDPFGHVFLTVITWPSDFYLFLPGWRCSCNPHQLAINYRCTRQEGEEMSETSGRIMNTAWEGGEEDEPEEINYTYYTRFSIYVFIYVFLWVEALWWCVHCVSKQNREGRRMESETEVGGVTSR